MSIYSENILDHLFRLKPGCPAAAPLLQLLLDTHHGVDEGENAAPYPHHHHVPAVHPHPQRDWPGEIRRVLAVHCMQHNFSI